MAPPNAAPEDAAALKSALRDELAALRDEGARGLGGVAHARRVAAVYDKALGALWSRVTSRKTRGRVALLAVGGYGRGTLGVGSDVDLVLLHDGRDPRAAHALAESLLYPLWDASVSVGHAVHSADDFVALAREDLRTETMLLDGRVLGGDRDLAAEALQRGVRACFEGRLDRFIDALRREMHERHARYGSTVYLLEPDVKHARGGLRDLDIARWALAARYRVADFDDALRVGALSEVEAASLSAAREFSWRVRAALHGRAGRRADRLTFDSQEEVATAFGWVDPAVAADDPSRAVGLGAERLMSTWYQRARDVATTLEHLLTRCRPSRASEHPLRRERLADDVYRFDGGVCLGQSDALQRDPALALRLVEVAVQRGMPVHASTRASIAAAASDPRWCEALRASEGAGRAFVRLLAHAGGARLTDRDAKPVSGTAENRGSVLSDLHDLGLVLAMIPEFGPVTAKVQHDVYHVYTVDVHSVAAVDRLHAMARGELGPDFALATELIADLDRREILCLGTLLHDVGKGRGGDHSRIGAGLARGIARRLGLGDETAATVSWLVEAHLELYHLATRRDLSDPATMERVLAVATSPWRLRALYLLTVADLSTTSPTAMTSWKARLLEECWRAASAAMTSRPDAGLPAAEARRREALALASPDERARVERWLSRMPPRYLAATPAAAVVRHARAVGDVPAGACAVHLAPLADDPSGTLLEAVVLAPDRPGLLARLAAMFFANRLDVQSAEIHSSGEGAADVFVLRRPDLTERDRRRLAETLDAQLRGLVEGAMEPAALVKLTRGGAGISRPEPAIPTRVRVVDEASDAATVVEVFGRDAPGFLFRVATTLHGMGLEVRLAKVNTEGRRAADVFYVTTRAGEKVTGAEAEAVSEALVGAVEGA